MTIFSWVVGLVGIMITAAFVLRLMLDLFLSFIGRPPEKPPNFLLRYGIGILVGFAVFGVSMMLSTPR